MTQDYEEYIPIKIDWSAPKRYDRKTLDGKWCRFLLRIQKATGLTLVGCDVTINDQINEQLKFRKKFPIGEWEKYFGDVYKIKKVLKRIAKDTGRVNCNYIPSDLLLYALWDDVLDDACLIMPSIVKYIYGVQCSPDDIYNMTKQNVTLEVFFREIIKMTTVSNDKSDKKEVGR